jgi:hypothetical protein
VPGQVEVLWVVVAPEPVPELKVQGTVTSVQGVRLQKLQNLDQITRSMAHGLLHACGVGSAITSKGMVARMLGLRQYATRRSPQREARLRRLGQPPAMSGQRRASERFAVGFFGLIRVACCHEPSRSRDFASGKF